MWSRIYEECQKCNSTQNPHIAKGLCNSCYLKIYRSNKENYDRIKKQKDEWYLLHRDTILLKGNKKRDLLHFNGNRKKALKRDNYKCCLCESTVKITVHHIDGNGRGSKNPNNNVKNLQALCRACHMNIHREDLNKNKSKKPGSYLKRQGKWSRKHDKCKVCSTTQIKHSSKGLCRSCQWKTHRVKNKDIV